jgi:cellulose synthase/poly-beta-1,6-N-acetylglucosamine synthase-like glycosyltransferase
LYRSPRTTLGALAVVGSMTTLVLPASGSASAASPTTTTIEATTTSAEPTTTTVQPTTTSQPTTTTSQPTTTTSQPTTTTSEPTTTTAARAVPMASTTAGAGVAGGTTASSTTLSGEPGPPARGGAAAPIPGQLAPGGPTVRPVRARSRTAGAPQELPTPAWTTPSRLAQRLLRSGAGPVREAQRTLQVTVDELSELSPRDLLILLLAILLSMGLMGVAGTTLWWMLHAWRTPATLTGTGFSRLTRAPRRSFSLIVPARHEETVLDATLAQLALSDHPDFEILVVVGHDDPATLAVAEQAAHRHPDRIRVLVDTNWPKNKPKALNTALTHCRGQITGVFDAEDGVHPQLLRHVDGQFADTGADVVQAGVQLMNYQASWYALRNVLEYYFWYRSRLHFHAGQRFIPLGGNTVFIRTELLRQVGGWDPECLAEDCELGVRLSSRGARVVVAYDPAMVTQEEAPASLRALFKQRTRWNQGFLQVLRKGEWRRLPTRRQRLLARYTLAMPLLQAFTGLLIPLSLAAIVLLSLPVLAALLSYLPLIPTIMVVAVEAAALGEFCRSYGRRPKPRDYVRLVLGALPYHALLAAAAVRAVARELRGERGWEKTAHVGAHRRVDGSPRPTLLHLAGSRRP